MNTYSLALYNFREIVKSASPAQIESATKWYLDAELLAHDIVSIFRNRGIECNLENAASVISSFSPRQRWSRNVVQAIEFANGGTPSGLKNNLRMAQFSMVQGFKALNGLKTNSFARNIAGDEFAVTVDVWMIKAAGIETKNSVNKTEYKEISNAVKVIANEIGLTPRTTQALIWIIFRGSAD